MATEHQLDEWPEPLLRQRLEPHLRSAAQPATLGDIVAATGLPAERTEPVLRSLLDEYRGRLAVDANGELLYSFPRGLTREQTWHDTLHKVLQTLWAWFKILYKVGYSVILVAYFLLFLVVMVATLVAMVAVRSNSSVDLDVDLEGCGCFPLDLFLWFWPDYTAPGSPQRVRTVPQPAGAAQRVPPWLRVFEFVFGEDQPAEDALAAERRLVDYIRAHAGRVTVADVVAQTGCTVAEAEETLVHLMVAHGGDVEVSDAGTLIYTFDRLMVTAQEPAPKGRRWTWWWEQRERRRRLNRNSFGANLVISLLNGFNLAWAGFFTLAGAALFGNDLAWWLLGPVPLLYSALFFFIPLVRAVQQQGENAAIDTRNRLRQLAAKFFGPHVISGHLPLVVPAELARFRPEQGPAPFSAAEAARGLEELARRWEAELETDGEGRVGFEFRRLRQDWADAEHARRTADRSLWQLGEIEYDSDDAQAEDDASWRRRMTGDEHGERG